MTKKLPVACAALLLFVTISPGLFAQEVAPAAPSMPATPRAAAAAPSAPSQATPGAAVAPPAAPGFYAALLDAPPPQDATPPTPELMPAPGTAAMGLNSLFEGDNFLGVSVEEVTRETMGRYGMTGEPRGLAVRSVVKGGPAERAGLREGDVILRFDGEAVNTSRKLSRLIDESSPNHSARLTVRRSGGGEQELNVTLGRRQGVSQFFDGTQLWRADELRQRADELRAQGEGSRQRGEEARRQAEELRRRFGQLGTGENVFTLGYLGGRRIGVTADSLSRQLADYFGVRSGLLVSSVVDGSPADKAGLKAGDVITEADGERIDRTQDLSRIVNRKEQGEVNLTIVRDKKTRTIRVTPERREPVFVNPSALVSPPARIVRPVAPARGWAPMVVPAAPRTLAAPRINPLPKLSPAPRPPVRGRIL